MPMSAAVRIVITISEPPLRPGRVLRRLMTQRDWSMVTDASPRHRHYAISEDRADIRILAARQIGQKGALTRNALPGLC
jgi:hypothetical protein